VRGAAGGQHGHPDADAERPPDEVTVAVAVTFLLVHLRLADRPGVGQHLEQDARLAVAVEPERERERGFRLAIVTITVIVIVIVGRSVGV
jgi:hypothetical protein